MHYSNLMRVHAIVKADSGEFLGADSLDRFGHLAFGADLPLLLRRTEHVNETWQKHCLRQRYLIRNPKSHLIIPGEPVPPKYVVNADNPPPAAHLVRYAVSVEDVTTLSGILDDAADT